MNLKKMVLFLVAVITLSALTVGVSARRYSPNFEFDEVDIISYEDADEVYEIRGVGNSDHDKPLLGQLRLDYEKYTAEGKYAKLRVSFVLEENVRMGKIEFNVNFADNLRLVVPTNHFTHLDKKDIQTSFNEMHRYITFDVVRDTKKVDEDANKIIDIQNTSKYYILTGEEEVSEHVFVSGPDTLVERRIGNTVDLVGAAVVTDIHPAWKTKGFVSDFGVAETDAKPIWKYSYSNIRGPIEVGADNLLPITGEYATFEREIVLENVTEITDATLEINADNAYTVSFEPNASVNKVFTNGYGDLDGVGIVDLLALQKTEKDVKSLDWMAGKQTYDNDDLLTSLNQALVNQGNPFKLHFVVANEYFNTGDYPNTVPGTFQNNPAALIYKLKINGKINIPTVKKYENTNVTLLKK